jgi:hypothetical protein
MPQGFNSTQIEWNFLRNQQRNWDVMVQLLGLRFQPSDITFPVKIVDSNVKFGEEYKDIKYYWWCSATFDHEILVDVLKSDFNEIPMIIGLSESVIIDKPYLITSGKNMNLVITV